MGHSDGGLLGWWFSDTDRVLLTVVAVLVAFLWARLTGGSKHKGAIPDRYTSFEQVQTAMRQAGLESSSLIVGVDFTKSNQWTGKRSFRNRCMHDTSAGEPTPYEEVLSIVAQTLDPFDDDKLIPCYGFGDSRTGDHAVFSFLPGDAPCRGLGEAVRRYRNVAAVADLSGPTSFAPLIHKAVEMVVGNNFSFHILLIVADGQVTNTEATVSAIVRASHYPLSIVMVGVGDGPWDEMRRFDDELPARKFDNFQFVDYTRMSRRGSAAIGPNVAAQCLMEVPAQYKFLRRNGMLGSRVTPPAPLPARVVTLPPPPGSVPANEATAPAAVAAAALPPTAPGAAAGSGSGGGGSSGGGNGRVPQEFICPLTLAVMEDPVVCADGHSYERLEIERWLERNQTSPLSNAPLPSRGVVPNHALRNAIQAYRATTASQ